MNQNYQRLAIWAAMLVLVLALWNLVSSTTQTRRPNEIAYSEFLEAVEKGSVSEVLCKATGSRAIPGCRSRGTTFST